MFGGFGHPGDLAGDSVDRVVIAHPLTELKKAVHCVASRDHASSVTTFDASGVATLSSDQSPFANRANLSASS